MTTPAPLDGWVYADGCVWCPRCNRAFSCDPYIPSIVAAPAGHRCEDDPGTGHYLRIPEVPADGWYWREPDGSLTRITGKFGRPA